MNAVETARKALLEEHESLKSEFVETKARATELEKSISQIEAALKALAPGKSAKAKRKSTKPFVKKPDVMKVCLQLVEDNPAIPRGDLETMIKERLASDFNLSGVSMRIRECLASEHFNVLEDKTVQLNTATT